MPERLQEAFGASRGLRRGRSLRVLSLCSAIAPPRSHDRRAFFFCATTILKTTLTSFPMRNWTKRRARLPRCCSKVASPDRECFLLHQPGVDFVAAFYGCLYAGAIAVTTYPAHRGRLKQSLPKIGELLKDAECSTILTTSDIAPIFTAAWKEVMGGDAPLVLASDAISSAGSGQVEESRGRPRYRGLSAVHVRVHQPAARRCGHARQHAAQF